MHERGRQAGTLRLAELPPLDPVTERRLQLPRLRRRIQKRASALAFVLADRAALGLELIEALELYRERREQAYFRLGLALGRAEPKSCT